MRWRPDHEIAITVKNLADVELVGAGVYRVELTSRGAAEIASIPKSPFLLVQFQRAENARANLTFSLRGGALARYELAVDTDLVTSSSTRLHVSYALTRELTDVGTTIIEVPDEVRRKIGK